MSQETTRKASFCNGQGVTDSFMLSWISNRLQSIFPDAARRSIYWALRSVRGQQKIPQTYRTVYIYIYIDIFLNVPTSLRVSISFFLAKVQFSGMVFANEVRIFVPSLSGCLVCLKFWLRVARCGTVWHGVARHQVGGCGPEQLASLQDLLDSEEAKQNVAWPSGKQTGWQGWFYGFASQRRQLLSKALGTFMLREQEKANLNWAKGGLFSSERSIRSCDPPRGKVELSMSVVAL